MYSIPYSSEKFYQQFTQYFDPFGIRESRYRICQAMFEHPDQLVEHWAKYTDNYLTIVMQSTRHMLGLPSEDLVTVNSFDLRFADPIWSENPFIDFIKETYLFVTYSIQNCILNTPDVKPLTKIKAAFWAKQYLDAISPTNFFWLNPKALTECTKTGGKSIYQGTQNFLEDLKNMSISMVDKSAFKVGVNLALTKGQVIYRNELIELIQYNPVTKKVHEIPIVIVPPWINKFYILDLNPEKSIVNYLLEQGFSVFIISWKNPNANTPNFSFEDYLFKGAYKAIKVAKEVCHVEQVHAVGYCIGGTALACLIAWLNAHHDRSVAHWTLFCSLIDFSIPGDIQVFTDEPAINYIEEQMAQYGYLDAKSIELTFRLLRSNSLIWRYVNNQYLMGKPLEKFDVLYWNVDGTNLSQKMHQFYLRNMYLENNLIKPNKLVLNKTSIDLHNIDQPLYCVGTEQDHISPWKGTFKTCQVVSGPVRYVLASSGHILGILDQPIEQPKGHYRVGDATSATDPDEWLLKQKENKGSWWLDWSVWLADRCGEWVTPPQIGNSKYKPLEDAPGIYVHEKPQ